MIVIEDHSSRVVAEFNCDFRLLISGLVLTLEGQLLLDGKFSVSKVIQHGHAPQRPLKNSIPQCLFLNCIPCDGNLNQLSSIIASYLEIESFFGMICVSFDILSNAPKDFKSGQSALLEIESMCQNLASFGEVYIVPISGNGTCKTYPVIPLNPNLFPSLKNDERIHFAGNPSLVSYEDIR